ncbi:pilus assembly protein PilM [Clostridia bacterium]|nr:pilus assembly protein PilM [Clostridia bacterium]
MKQRLSIDIGSKNLHIVLGQYAKNKLIVNQANSFPIPEEAEKVGKDVAPEVLEEIIADAMRLMNVKTKQCIVTINSENAAIKDIELPVSKAKEVKQMIENEMVQTYQTAGDDIIQYRNTGKIEKENGNTMQRYRVAALDKLTVERYYELLLKLKFKKTFLDLNINAIDKLLNGASRVNDHDISEESVLLLDYGHNTTTAYVKVKGEPVFFRTLQIGSGEIEQILELETLKSRSEIRQLKERGKSFFSDDTGMVKLFDLLKPYFYHFQDELSKILSFYSTHERIGHVDRVFLMGKGAELAGLPEYLTENLGFPVELFNSVRFGTEELIISPAHVNAVAALIRA